MPRNSFPRSLFFVILLLFSLTGAAKAKTTDEANNIEIYLKAAPGVVNISSVVVKYDFFYNPIPQEGVGSGVIIDERGYIVTNNHIIEDARSLEVTLADGSKWRARLVGADPDNDLAVIKIDLPDRKLTVLSVGSSKDLKVGQKVLAIGNPFGLGQTLTTGVISSLGRSIRTGTGSIIRGVIQTDAAINPGNSGGPLLNSRGEMIGINTAIVSPTGANVGIGFGIPVDTVTSIVPRLIPGKFSFYGIRPPVFLVLIFLLFYLSWRALQARPQRRKDV